MEYTCEKCGMGVKNLTCTKCNAPLINDLIHSNSGQQIQVAKCPSGCGQIKSPVCCGQDMSCKV